MIIKFIGTGDDTAKKWPQSVHKESVGSLELEGRFLGRLLSSMLARMVLNLDYFLSVNGSL